jgi:hypothetical protein
MDRRIPLYPSHDDDPEFIGRIGVIIDSLIAREQPGQVIVVKIDNWFSVRWLNFTRKAVGALRIADYDARIPPFVPNRVVSQQGFRRSETGDYVPFNTSPLHLRQISEQNQYRLARRKFDDALLVWYGGQTTANDNGSLMIYRIAENMTSTGYVSFARNKVWRLHTSLGMLSKELLATPV